MGIYSSWWYESADVHHDECNVWIHGSADGTRVQDIARACSCQAGPYVYYGSHVMPHTAGPRGGSVDVAAIPHHCRPDAVGDDGPLVDFLRLSVDEDERTHGQARAGSASVVLDRSHVEQLYRVLGEWLDAPERS